ncbi:MAG: ACP S-malonyltransferase [Verrucomicrobia bacterium]|nr:ACP S-malonyltransferase [Verrucomicrobiota bacterium]
MTKTALLFAGQGAQYVGMGRDLAERYAPARDLFQQANETLGYDLARVCAQGPEFELTKTEHAQPGIFVVSWIALQLLQRRVPSLTFEAAAGLSLGEFTALAAAGTFTFEDGLRLVRQRGQFMHEACDATHGSMAAVIGLAEEPTRAVCAEAGVELANLNCPGQLVISGETERVAQACELAKARGAKRALRLPVAGAYHSRLMTSARAKLDVALATVILAPPRVPVISNVTAQPHGTPETIRTRLVEQVTSSVRWEETIRYLLDQGHRQFLELGPGTALSGFLKRIAPQARVLNVGDPASLEATVAALAAEPARILSEVLEGCHRG